LAYQSLNVPTTVKSLELSEAEFLVQANNDFMVFYGTIFLTSLLGAIALLQGFKDFKNTRFTISCLYFILVGGIAFSVSGLVNLFRGNYVIISSGSLGNSTDWLKQSTNYYLNGITSGWFGSVLGIFLMILFITIFVYLYWRKISELNCSAEDKSNIQPVPNTQTGNPMATTNHELSVRVQAPKMATEGETTKYHYIVKNTGSTTFNGIIQMKLSWSSENQNVYQPLNINNLLSGSEISIEYSQAPLMSGYTWFAVVGASANDGAPVIVRNEGGNQVFPFVQVGNQSFVQALYGMRARSNEEKFSKYALLVAAISLAIVAVFQVADWALRFFVHI
jgi:hypothetical protein